MPLQQTYFQTSHKLDSPRTNFQTDAMHIIRRAKQSRQVFEITTVKTRTQLQKPRVAKERKVTKQSQLKVLVRSKPCNQRPLGQIKLHQNYKTKQRILAIKQQATLAKNSLEHYTKYGSCDNQEGKVKTLSEILLYKTKKQKKEEEVNPKKMKFGWQQMIIWKLFQDLKGTASKDLRKKAVALTGLRWKQIYKWVFDRILNPRNFCQQQPLSDEFAKAPMNSVSLELKCMPMDHKLDYS